MKNADREEARDAYHRLYEEDCGFRDAVNNAKTYADRIPVLARIVKVSDQLAELRPKLGGRTVHVRRDQEQWRTQATLARDAIRAEHARHAAAERGLDLPDPLGLPDGCSIPEEALPNLMTFVADAYEQFAGWTPPRPTAASAASATH